MHRVRFVRLTREIATKLGVETYNRPTIAWAGVEDAPRSRGKRSIVMDGRRVRILGMGGLFWQDGLCWLWLDAIMMERTSAVMVVRSAKAMLKKAVQLGEERVFAIRDEAPRSEKLLRLLGFERWPDHPALKGKELWEWQNWPLSRPSQQPPQQ